MNKTNCGEQMIHTIYHEKKTSEIKPDFGLKQKNP